MFEGSMLESRGLVISKTQKWTTLGSLVLQSAVAACLIAIPMLRPEILPVSISAPKITFPNLKPVQMVQHLAQTTASTVAITVRVPNTVVEQTQGFVFPIHPVASDMPDAPASIGTMSDTNPLAPLAAIGTPSPQPAMTPRTKDTRPLRVSSGVSSGLLLAPVRPIYPALAKAAGIQGSVVIEAVISKTGRVDSLSIVSGPELLRSAAMDAVRSARYAPYKLNGEPVDVQTVITIVFRMGA